MLDNEGNENWEHLDSENNVADIDSRGCSPKDLMTHNLWLEFPKDRWSVYKIPNDTELEAKAVKVFNTTTFLRLNSHGRIMGSRCNII